jgi:serine phosphatase RsbU (regulator of sigma subunit)
MMMTSLNVILAGALFLSALFTAGMALYALRHRNAAGASTISLFMLALTVYSAGYGCELLNDSLEGIIFCLRIEYIGVSFIPPLYIITVAQIATRRKWRLSPVTALLVGLSVLTLFFHYTNEHHHLFYAGVGVDRTGPFPVAVLEKGPWYWLHIAYVNTGLLYVNILLVRMLMRSSSLLRKQAVIMLAGSFIPWVALIVYLLGYSPWNIDLNPFALSLTGVIFTWGLLRHGLINIIPLAYDTLFLRLPDGVLVLDPENLVAGINPAAQEMLDAGDSVIGTPAREVLTLLSEAVTGNISGEYLVKTGDGPGKERWLDIRSSPLEGRRGADLGRLLTLRDVSATKEMETAIRASEKRMRNEIAKVRNIQAVILPDFSRVTGYDIASLFLPADDISGDFFDGYFISDTVFQVIICDVMDHGMASAYIGMEIRSLFRAFSMERLKPPELIRAVNVKLSEDFSGIMYYATVAVCQLDLGTDTLVYSSGGHPPSLYLPAGGTEVRETGFMGPLIGLNEKNNYMDITLTLKSGDGLLMYTDGITEALDARSGEMFGRENLAADFIASGRQPSKEVVRSALEKAFEFTDYAAIDDDITMICIRKKEGG